MGVLDRVVAGPCRARPAKFLLHAPPKLGKSHFAAGAPVPLFLDAERGTLEFDVARLAIEDWRAVEEALDELLRGRHAYQTIVLDTLDSLERALVAEVIRADGKAHSIDVVGGGYGKGWDRAAERWKRLCDALDRLQAERGMHVVVLAHSKVEHFSDPDSGEEWDRWSLLCHKKTAAVFVGWVDELLFLTRDVRGDREGHGRGGQRILHARWSPGRLCGSRRNLPAMLPIPEGAPPAAWSVLARAFDAAAGTTRAGDMERVAAAIAETPEAPKPAEPPANQARTIRRPRGRRAEPETFAGPVKGPQNGTPTREGAPRASDGASPAPTAVAAPPPAPPPLVTTSGDSSLPIYDGWPHLAAERIAAEVTARAQLTGGQPDATLVAIARGAIHDRAALALGVTRESETLRAHWRAAGVERADQITIGAARTFVRLCGEEHDHEMERATLAATAQIAPANAPAADDTERDPDGPDDVSVGAGLPEWREEGGP